MAVVGVVGVVSVMGVAVLKTVSKVFTGFSRVCFLILSKNFN